VLLPAAAISGLSLALAAGLELTGLLATLNAHIARIVSRGGAETFPKQLPAWAPWAAAAFFSVALTAGILGSPSNARRLMLWLVATVLVAAWAPVLSLAAHRPEIAGPWIATFWSGICSLVYASRHGMPTDQTARPQS
jgi:hypothetical protein